MEIQLDEEGEGQQLLQSYPTAIADLQLDVPLDEFQHLSGFSASCPLKRSCSGFFSAMLDTGTQVSFSLLLPLPRPAAMKNSAASSPQERNVESTLLN
jgi:hypothetical protein